MTNPEILKNGDSFEEKIRRLQKLTDTTINKNLVLQAAVSKNNKLIETVQKMRHAQKAFFKTNLIGVAKKDLQNTSMDLERECDVLLLEIAEIKIQLNLF